MRLYLSKGARLLIGTCAPKRNITVCQSVWPNHWAPKPKITKHRWNTTLPWQWSLITISQENHWFHHTFPTDHCRLVSISSRKVRWRSSTYKGHLSLDVTHLHYSDVCVWSVWRLKCFLSNLVHLHKRYRVKWVTCIGAFDVGNDFPAYQISCYSGFGLSERQILFSDVK